MTVSYEEPEAIFGTATLSIVNYMLPILLIGIEGGNIFIYLLFIFHSFIHSFTLISLAYWDSSDWIIT